MAEERAERSTYLGESSSYRFGSHDEPKELGPKDEIAQETTVVKYSYSLELDKLSPGTVIEGLSAGLVRDVINKLGQKLAEKADADSRFPPGPSPRAEPTDLTSVLEKELYRKRFFGKTGNYKVVILPPRLDLVAPRKAVFRPPHVATILAVRDLFSTGRGKIGSAATECTIYLQGTSHSHYYDTGLITRALNDDSVERMIQDSEERWRTALREGLKRVISAGLPSLGRRR